ncbi:MAG: chemotaxis protein CheA [Nitrospirae bacterium]|nr:chemotaxis protein CheA [Nitrospirota bacterium]
MDFDHDLLIQTYLAEAEEQLVRMEESLVLLETQPENKEMIEILFRAAHTLKGNASTTGFMRVAEFAHGLEDVLQQLRKGTRVAESRLITLLLRAVDFLRRVVPEYAAGTDESLLGDEKLFKQLTGLKLDEIDEKETSLTASGSEARGGKFERREDEAREGVYRNKTLRVDLDKLDRLLNLAGEITIARGRFSQILEERAGKLGQEVLEANTATDALFLELQEEIMKIRMVPVGPMFRQLIRTVRDVALAHGKTARLVIEGGEVEVDTAMIELLKDPIAHMIRNALDHGIESPEIRAEKQKDPCGQLILRAFHDSGNVVIQLMDDGSGFNRKRIIEKAVSKGLISESQKLSNAEVYSFIFMPGFSTSETVTDLSGRGVGMDVVKRNIEALRGSIEIDSQEEKGSALTIRLPLTLAIIDGFAVGVGKETYIIPIENVIECVDLTQQNRRDRDGQNIINLREKVLPYFYLRENFGLGGEALGRESIVVVKNQDRLAGIVVDTLFGENQVVIKPLGKFFQGLPGVSGSTILGNGKVALILDIPALIRDAAGKQTRMADQLV